MATQVHDWESHLEFLLTHFEDESVVARELGEDATPSWIRQISRQANRTPSDKIKSAIVELAQTVRQRMQSESGLHEKIRELKAEHGSWDRFGRRLGVSQKPYRLAVTQGTPLSEKQKRKIRKAYRHQDLEHLLGWLAVGVGMQLCCALEETQLSDRQRQMIDSAMEQFDDYHHLLQLGNVDEIKEEVCGD